jgi:ATP synthase I chain
LSVISSPRFSGGEQNRNNRLDKTQVDIQQRILTFVTRTNWILFAVASAMGFLLMPADFAGGILCGGLLVTANFHLLARTLKKALTPPHLTSHNVVIAKYFIRFVASGFIIFILIAGHFVNPLGLIIGLSVVVFSIMLATLCELKKLIFKEAV